MDLQCMQLKVYSYLSLTPYFPAKKLCLPIHLRHSSRLSGSLVGRKIKRLYTGVRILVTGALTWKISIRTESRMYVQTYSSVQQLGRLLW